MKAKGTTPPNIPKTWLHNEKIEKTDSEEERLRKYRHNALVISQKPYFFIYLYKNLANDYKAYQKGFDMLAKKQFGCGLTTMLSKECNDEELNFLRRYRKYSPVIETRCVMNNICRQVEHIDNAVKWDKTQHNILLEFADFSHINQTIVEKLYDLIKKYNSRKSVRGLQLLVETDGLNDDDINEMFRDKLYTHKDLLKERIRDLFVTEQDMFNHMMYMAISYNMSVDVVWEIMGDYVISCIPWGNTYIVSRDENGQEYLGQHLSIKEVN